MGPKSSATGLIAAYQVKAGSVPPNRVPSPHLRNGYEHNPDGEEESSKM